MKFNMDLVRDGDILWKENRDYITQKGDYFNCEENAPASIKEFVAYLNEQVDADKELDELLKEVSEKEKADNLFGV